MASAAAAIGMSVPTDLKAQANTAESGYVGIKQPVGFVEQVVELCLQQKRGKNCCC